MNPAGAVMLLVVWWWVAFLAVLPRDVTSRWEAPDDGVKGADPGAPTSPKLKQKAWLATKVALVLWGITCAIIISGIFDFQD